MTMIPFARLVRSMRAMQRLCYVSAPDVKEFGTLLIEDLREKEKEVDRAIREIFGQPTLFDREDDPKDS